VFRVKLIFLLAVGLSFTVIQRQLQTTAPTIVRWKERFLANRVDGLDTVIPANRLRF
jgi:hypothetical protein